MQDPDEGWSTVPPDLNAPITDILTVSLTTGYVPKPDQLPVSLLTFLSNLIGVPMDEYRLMLLEWMTAHRKVLVVQQWLNDHGSMWTQYRDHLLSGGAPDSLEFLIMCMAMRFHLNCIQEDHFWSTHLAGPEQSDPTVMLTLQGLQFCDWFVEGTIPTESRDQKLSEPLEQAEVVNISDDDSLSNFYIERPSLVMTTGTRFKDRMCCICEFEA